MEAVLAFAAALVALRLAGGLVSRWRARRRRELAAWAASLGAYALASAALAWGAAWGWSEASFRVYYLAGGLLTAPLLGLGSLLLRGVRAALPTALVYCGLAVGVAIAAPVSAVSGKTIPDASDHLDFFPARLLAIVGNSVGTIAVVGVALATIRRRPIGNSLILAGVAVAAVGTALAGLGEAQTAVSIALAAGLLYAGFILNK
ncbi:MAG TPA: hypothetical protein VKA45_02180 [Gaiellaceae bacterium]|nr:hypothetical protein [Gaiellaceae bacterium]